MADRLSEAADYQNLKKDAPFYYWHITASNSPQESQQTIRGSVRKTNRKTNPSIELKMDNQLNLKQLFIPDRYFRDLRQNKEPLKTNAELIEMAHSFIKKNSKLLIPAGITPNI